MLLGQVYSQMTQVFDNPEEVLMKFIQMATEKVLLVRWTNVPFSNHHARCAFLALLHSRTTSTKSYKPSGSLKWKTTCKNSFIFITSGCVGEGRSLCPGYPLIPTLYRAMLMRDQLARMETKIDSTFLTKTIRATLFGSHLSGYAE